MLYEVKNHFVLVLHSFSKHLLLVLGVSILAWWAIEMGLISLSFTVRDDLSQFPLVVVWESTEEKSMPMSLLLLDKVF